MQTTIEIDGLVYEGRKDIIAEVRKLIDRGTLQRQGLSKDRKDLIEATKKIKKFEQEKVKKPKK